MPQSTSTPGQSGNQPTIFIVTDSAAGEGRCHATVDAVGGRVIAAEPPGVALDAMAKAIAFDVALVDLDGDHGSHLDRLLERIEAAAQNGQYRSVIAITADLIDIVEGQAVHPDIAILCGANSLERAAALGLAVARRSPVLRDINSESDEARLRRLSEEAANIAVALADLSYRNPDRAARRETALSEVPQTFITETGRSHIVAAEEVRTMIRMRRLRDRFFASELFADPAWDMLLDLMAARIESRHVAVSSLCIAAAVPPTTALRWIRTMTEKGLFIRRPDPRDGRRVFIELSDQAASALEHWFAAARSKSEESQA